MSVTAIHAAKATAACPEGRPAPERRPPSRVGLHRDHDDHGQHERDERQLRGLVAEAVEEVELWSATSPEKTR